MLNDQVWRQVPCDIVNNPRIRSIAKRMPQEYRQAVFAFYVSIYMEADVDGFIDLSDIEVYADQLMIDDEEVINTLIERFCAKDFIKPVKNGTYFLTDFSNPNNFKNVNGHKVYETADERRERINNSISGAKKKKPAPQKIESAPESYPQESAAEPEKPSFFAPSVTHSEKASQTLKKEIHTDRQTNTHTQEKEKETESARTENINTEIKDNAEPEENTEAQDNADTSTVTTELAEQAIDTEQESNAGQEAQTMPEVLEEDSSQKALTMLEIKQIQKEYEIPDTVAARLIALRSQSDWKVAQIFYTFFKRSNPTLYNDEVQLDIIQQLILDTGQCAEPKNPPHIIAAQLCTQFENLVNQRGAFSSGYQYFKGMALTPKLMRSPSVWPRIWAEVYKTLSPGKTAAEKLETTLKRWADEVTSEKTIYGDPNFFNEQMLKKGVDPNTKGAMMAFLAKIAAEQKMRKRE